MILKTLAVGPLEVNCYLIGDTAGSPIGIVDPGGDADMILDAVRVLKRNVSFIINTHCHFDHVGGVSDLIQELKADYLIHYREKDVLGAIGHQMEMFGFKAVTPPIPTRLIRTDEQLALGNLQIQILHTPGHSPGGICLWSSATGQLISGDTLFRESVGRTDLPGGNSKTLIDSITAKLLSLPETTRVYPGHGPSTTIGHETRFNPFL